MGELLSALVTMADLSAIKSLFPQMSHWVFHRLLDVKTPDDKLLYFTQCVCRMSQSQVTGQNLRSLLKNPTKERPGKNDLSLINIH